MTLDPWQGRRQKPLVNGRRNQPLSFGQQLIHDERMRKIRAQQKLDDRTSLMPHLRKGNVPDNDAPPPRLERSTRFDPSPPPKHVARVAEDHDGCTATDTPQPAAGDEGVHFGKVKRAAKTKRAEAEALSDEEIIQRKRRTKKQKLIPGGRTNGPKARP